MAVRVRGALGILLPLLRRVVPSPGPYRWLANRIAGSTIPETLVSASGVVVSQLWPERVLAMEELAQRHLKGPFVALEIGTWFGAGSTAIWAARLSEGSKLFLVDSWREYISPADRASATAYAGMDSVHHVAIAAALRRVYEYERKTRGEIFLMRGRASAICRFFKPESFDLVYVDGSHYYADVVEDVRVAKGLVKDGGVICGDDLELSPSPELLALARRHLDRDFVAGGEDGKWFHPGVLLAVAEEFESVTNHAGFWSVIRRGDRWLPA